ncbi:hypothetical protein PVAND_008681 [Polypedilum vanderplanki]|uniref:BPTI/Kunitz inhibitor domain-containing protein n=1 Tax=Polypedilum vanderplanki TaxID=319348 RepID=A0A9J6CBT9_POLVA|nr:hypothetical protein PVAND_008681 [Polypedilum vanderplanki]
MNRYFVFSFIILLLTIVEIHCGSEEYQDCKLPPDSGYECPNGSSTDPSIQYYAHFPNGFCDELPYKGCGGNSNRFTDLTYCESYCAFQGAPRPE